MAAIRIARQKTKKGINYKVPTARKSTGGVAKTGQNGAKDRSRTNKSEKDCAPEDSQESWRARKQDPLPSQKQNEIFLTPRIPWGGSITYQGEIIKIFNTCSFDNQMYILNNLINMRPQVRSYINLYRQNGEISAKLIFKMCTLLENNRFDEAKKIVVEDILSMKDSEIRTGNMFGSEERFLSRISNYVRLIKYHDCPNLHCEIPKIYDVYPITAFFIRNVEDFSLQYNLKRTSKCDFGPCGAQVEIHYEFPRNTAPPFLVFNVGKSSEFRDSKVPRKEIILGHMYHLFAYTLSTGSHFYTILYSNGQCYKYDGLKPANLQPHNEGIVKHTVSTIWMTKAESGE